METIPFNREGWGICAADGRVLTSDGTSELISRDPGTLEPLGMIGVRCDGERVTDLNDLEWAGGQVWANLLGKRYLVGIDPGTGEVTDIVDAKAVMERHWGDRGGGAERCRGAARLPESSCSPGRTGGRCTTCGWPGTVPPRSLPGWSPAERDCHPGGPGGAGG